MPPGHAKERPKDQGAEGLTRTPGPCLHGQRSHWVRGAGQQEDPEAKGSSAGGGPGCGGIAPREHRAQQLGLGPRIPLLPNVDSKSPQQFPQGRRRLHPHRRRPVPWVRAVGRLLECRGVSLWWELSVGLCPSGWEWRVSLRGECGAVGLSLWRGVL